MVDCGGGVLDCTREEVECVYNAVALADCRLREVVVEELDCVGEQERFCGAVHDVEASIMLERGADVKSAAAAEVPRFAYAGLSVDDDWASNWAKRCCVKVERALEVLPRRH